MPYVIQKVSDLYRDPETTEADDIGRYLSTLEEQGFRLAGVLQDHRVFDENMDLDGFVGAMFILHKEGDA